MIVVLVKPIRKNNPKYKSSSLIKYTDSMVTTYISTPCIKIKRTS